MIITPKSVWYLAHPVAPDALYTYEQNLAHTVKMINLCYEEGFRVYAPWHTLCLAMPDSDPVNRKIGLEVDCALVKMSRLLIMTGHKVSSGMQEEWNALKSLPSYFLIDATGKPDRMVREQLRAVKDHLSKIGGVVK